MPPVQVYSGLALCQRTGRVNHHLLLSHGWHRSIPCFDGMHDSLTSFSGDLPDVAGL